MKLRSSSRRFRRTLLVSATAVAASAAMAAALASSATAQPAARAGTSHFGPGGYPPPGGIYTGFTNCPLRDPIMQEVSDTNGGGFAGCIFGLATSGSITTGTITTPVVEPVNVQFGVFIPPGDSNFYPAPVVPPLGPTTGGRGGFGFGQSVLDRSSFILSTQPDPIPESLTTALGCATATDPTVMRLCQVAQARGGRFNQVTALAQDAGNISNFDLLSWTQPIKFQLINPLLGHNCYIGSDYQPVVVNPQLSVGPGGTFTETPDPDPAAHPDTFTLDITGAIASDTTFTVPGVTGCGPGGLDNIAVDNAIDTSSGLPAASGTNSLTLNGNFDIAATDASEDSTLTQPQNDAQILLSAFIASSKAGGQAGRPVIISAKHGMTTSQLESLLKSILNRHS
jgi:hypothetical protein